LRPGIVGTLGNAFYLNRLFATGRGVLYLMVWFGLAARVLRSMRHGDLSAALAVIGLILLGWTTTFAAVDATMSLDPHFVSSNYGMIAAAEAGLLALLICVLAAALDARFPRDALDDLGRLLLGLLVLWAYLDFIQFLIVWQSDLPREAAWYIARSSQWWGALAAIVALGHFILPFFALMSPPLRDTRRGIGAVAVLLIAMEGLRAWWLVLPADHRGIGLLDVSAMLAFAGLSAGVALHGPRQRLALLRTHHG
jgi:hypothetical protein